MSTLASKKYMVTTIVLSLLLVALCVQNAYYYGWRVQDWDLLYVSGVIIFIPGVYMAFSLPKRSNDMLNRLVHRGALDLNKVQLEQLEKQLQQIANQWCVRTGILIAAFILLAFIKAFGFPIPTSRIPITVMEVLGGFIAGLFLGHMAGYGKLGWVLRKMHISIKVQPGHIDGVAGLKPVGEFYFFQAKIAGLPAVFLAVWLSIIMFLPTHYIAWRTPYAILLAIAIVFEILVFIVPLYSFHQLMVAQKRISLQNADELSQDISEIERQLTKEQNAEKRELLKDRLASMTKEYWDVENMPTWPVAIKTKKVFRRNNMALTIPLLLDIISQTSFGKSPLWQRASEIIERVLT